MVWEELTTLYQPHALLRFNSREHSNQRFTNNKNIYRGVTTGLTKAFFIDNDTKEALVSEDSKSEELLRPLLRGRDIGRYQSNWMGMWIIDAHNGYGNTAPVDIDLYPAIKQHLDSFSPKLDNRYDQGITKYNLRSCAYRAEFDKEKIVYAEIVKSPNFFLDYGHFYPDATSLIITGPKLKYLIGVLNSKPAWYFFSEITSTQMNWGLVEVEISERLF